MMARMTTRRSLAQIFAVPLMIAIVSIAGLVSALVGDGRWNTFSWFALGLPVLLYVYCVGRPRP
jgi:hypothetical protein